MTCRICGYPINKNLVSHCECSYPDDPSCKIVPPQGGSGTAPPTPAEPPGKKTHPFLAAKLYEHCPGCNGTRKTTAPMMVDKLKRDDGATYSGPVKIGSACPLCEDGYVETGLTVGQVERVRAQLDVLKEFCEMLASHPETNSAMGWAESAKLTLRHAKLLPARPGEDVAQTRGDNLGDANAAQDG